MDADCDVSGDGAVYVPDVPVGGAAEEEPHFIGREGGRERGRRAIWGGRKKGREEGRC